MVDVAARHDKLFKAIERPFKRKVWKEKNRYIRKSAAAYSSLQFVPSYLLEEHMRNMTSICKQYWERTMRVFSAEVEDMLAALKADTADKRFLLLFEEFLNTEALQRVGNIALTTKRDVETAIAVAVDEGLSPVQVARSILRVRGLSSFRAETIARTETHGAAMYASKRNAELLSEEFGFQTLKKWVPAVDERTRANHAAMANHKAIPLDEKFNVGGVPMDKPSDPAGGPSNVINCRCVLTYTRAE